MKSSLPTRLRNPYLVAVVLGTALAAAGPEESASASPISPGAISNISRYCTACWRNARLPQDEWNDCTQEVLCRLLKSLPAKAWERALANDTEERREFVRAIDAVKKRYQRGRWQCATAPELVTDSRNLQEREACETRQAVHEAASKVLSGRQQSILRLVCDGHGIADIAAQLAMSPERVSDEKYKAIQKLRTFFSVA